MNKIGFKTAVAVTLGWRFGNFLADTSGELLARGLIFAKKYKDDPEKALREFKNRVKSEPKQEIKMGFM